MFFTRKKGRNNLIYPSVHRQANYDTIKYYVKDSALFKSNVKRLNIEENDVNLYLSYIFSKYVKIIETKNEELQLALAKKENGIDADNIEELGEEAEEITLLECIQLMPAVKPQNRGCYLLLRELFFGSDMSEKERIWKILKNYKKIMETFEN